MRFAKPLDEELLHAIFRKFQKIVTLEEGVLAGGFGSAVLEFGEKEGYRNSVTSLGIPDKFIDHGKVEELQEIAKIDVQSIEQRLKDLLKKP